MAEPTPDPEAGCVEAILPHLSCPVCAIEYTHPVHPRTLIPDPYVLVCTTGGCRQYGKQFHAPTVKLWPKETT